MFKQFFILFNCFTLIITLSACDKKDSPKKEMSRPVKILTIGNDFDAKSLEYPGRIKAATEAKLGFEVAGKIVELPISEGQEVQRGDIIAKLDQRDFKSNFDAAKSQRETAQANFTRASELKKQNFISQADFDSLKSKLDNAKSQFEKAEKALQDSVLMAPFSGTIAEKFVKNFTNVQAKEIVVLLHDKTGLEVEIHIPENDWQYAKPEFSNNAQKRHVKPTVTISPFPDRSFEATIKSLSTLADPTTRTYSATLSFSAPNDIVILPGMSAKVSVRVDKDITKGVLIPANAVASDPEGKAYVWLIGSDMRVARHYVNLGELRSTGVEVLEGLTNGQRIAITGVKQLNEGMTVTQFGNY